MSLLPLSLENIALKKSDKRILGPIDVQIEGAGCTILLGPNGAGKTSLLRLMHGLERPTSGRLKWKLNGTERFQRQSYIFQSPVIMRRSVIENVIYPLLVRGQSKKGAIEAGMKWLEKVELAELAQESALTLSGGEKQKLAMARALIVQPEVLFLDEPSTNLDGASTVIIEQLILNGIQSGMRAIMATHDLGQAKRLADDVLFLHHGCIVEKSGGKMFFETSQTSEAKSFLRGDILI